jgi:hypothetical protein
MVRLLLFAVIALAPAFAQDYWHRVTGSFGGFVPLSGAGTTGFDTAPVLAVDYGFRFSRYGQFDFGADTAFASREPDGRTNIYVPRIGYSLVVPVWQRRIEAIAGGGGAYAFYKPRIGNEGWLVYGQLGANYALDPDQRYRAGMTIRWYRDPVGSPVQQWLSVAATVSYSWAR